MRTALTTGNTLTLHYTEWVFTVVCMEIQSLTNNNAKIKLCASHTTVSPPLPHLVYIRGGSSKRPANRSLQWALFKPFLTVLSIWLTFQQRRPYKSLLQPPQHRFSFQLGITGKTLSNQTPQACARSQWVPRPPNAKGELLVVASTKTHFRCSSATSHKKSSAERIELIKRKKHR